MVETREDPKPAGALDEHLKDWLVKEAQVKDVILARLAEDTPQSPRQKFWAFLNQSFTLWFLSSILVGGLSLAYTEWQENLLERQRTRATIERLDIEISSRVTTAITRLDSAEDGVGLAQAVKLLDSDSGVFLDYRERSMRSLLFELSRLVEVQERVEVESALGGYKDVQPFRAWDPEESEETFQSRHAALREELSAGRFSVREWAG